MSLFKNISLQQLWQVALHTFFRFPMVLLSAITGTAIVILLIELESSEPKEWLIKLVLISSVGLILFFTLELLVRRYKLAQRGRMLTWLGGLSFLVLYFFLLPEEPDFKSMLRHLALVFVLHLMASYAMFLNRRQENAFWQFNKSLFLRVLTSVLYSGVLYIGLVVAIVALDQLFAIQVDEKIYPELWVFMVGVFNTWFFLAGVPLNVEELEEAQDYPKGLKVFTQFVLLTLVTIYLVILYAYFGKIVVQWEWPEGWVSVLVLVFSIVGILSLLLIHPIRNLAGNTWIRTFSKWFYRALFPLTILLALAIWRRVSEYGITEERYVVLALAVWLLIAVLYFLFSSAENIKFIPVTLSIVTLLAAFGPVNMFVVSEWSQVSRLQNLLRENGIMEAGKVNPKHGPVEQEAKAEISAIVDYLSENHDFDSLEDWFTVDLSTAIDTAAINTDSKWGRRAVTRDLVLELMGLDYTTISKAPVERYFSFTMNGYAYEDKSEVYTIAEYDYVAEVLFSGNGDGRQELKLGKNPLIVSMRDNSLYFQIQQESLYLNLEPIIKKLNKMSGSIRTKSELTYTLQGKQARIQVVLQELSGNQKGKKCKTTDAKLLLFVQVP
ncbi:hypothetical protein ABID22_000769 [Pontibacter aydingkolensis]|uniref:DUF4153 domain-containing protein n=1 Tax=Pontibacter aydingkolensis TaxID=1911536 RepID=A0ABS7CR85_9BACT|nr:DUF4153 domain-containing protein [Pontibacter aydingkolensis]MBW7466361.1 DUF4153 domain-containing protein [Pontibacter aydingkolensis]